MAPKVQVPESLGTIAVIGGCGLTGHHIVALLRDESPKSKVFGVDLNTNRFRISGAEYVDCDITNEARVQEVFQKIKPDVVIHTAAAMPATSDPALRKKEFLWKVNVDGTNNVLKAAQENGAKAFVYTSSASVTLTRVSEYHNRDESWPVVIGDQQPDYYSNTKGIAELAVLGQNRKPSDKFLTCALRPASIYGPGDTTILQGLLQVAATGRSKFQVGTNDNLFDYTYVQNLAYAHILAAAALVHTSTLSTKPLDHEKVDGEAFHITNDEPVYFWDFARAVWHEAGFTAGTDLSKVWVMPQGLMMAIATIASAIMTPFGKTPQFNPLAVRYSSMTRYFNITKAKQRLGYEPQVSLQEGIKRGVPEVMERLGLNKDAAGEKKTQ